MILLWGVPGDGPLDRVHDALRRAGAPIAFFDQRALADARIALLVEADATVGGSLETPDQAVDLRAVTAAYLRYYD